LDRQREFKRDIRLEINLHNVLRESIGPGRRRGSVRHFPRRPRRWPFGWQIYRLHQQLIGLRRRHPWLYRARSRVTELRNCDLVFEAFDGENRLWVALNLGHTSIARTIPALVDRLVGDLVVHRKGTTTEIVLPAYGWGILADAAG
jgi:hypothetical protein